MFSYPKGSITFLRQSLFLSPQVWKHSSAVPGSLYMVGKQAGRLPVVATINDLKDSLILVWE